MQCETVPCAEHNCGDDQRCRVIGDQGQTDCVCLDETMEINTLANSTCMPPPAIIDYANSLTHIVSDFNAKFLTGFGKNGKKNRNSLMANVNKIVSVMGTYDSLDDSVNHNCLADGFDPAWDEFNEFATVVLVDILNEQSRQAAQAKMLSAFRTITDAFFKRDDEEAEDASFIMMPIGERSNVGGLTKAERKAAKKLNKENKKQFFSRSRRAAGKCVILYDSYLRVIT